MSIPRFAVTVVSSLLTASSVLSVTACAARSSPAMVSSPSAAAARDTHERLNAVLWMETAAEYWAASVAAYAAADRALDAALRDRAWTAAIEQTGNYESLPPAVILDVDETVLDNAPLQGQLVLDRRDYSQQYWEEWVRLAVGAPIPGAADFLASAAKRGVDLFFVTNRTAAEQDKTIEALVKAGLKASDANVLCTGENGWTSDKTARRAEIAKSHRILLLVGDDLNDFVSTAKLTPDQRMALATTHRRRWGLQWIMIPNPVYGSWERALYPGISADAEILRRKRDQVRGFKGSQIK